MKHAILNLFYVLLTCRSVYSQVKVAAYYYPWHTNNFHNNQGYLRRYLQQGPLLGEYNDRKPDVINQHVTWSEYANINVWITSWFGPNSQTDETLLSSILPTISSSALQFALFYETVNRVGVTIPTTKRIVDDIIYICENYLTHPNYYRIQNKPVLFIYITRVLQQLGTLAEVLLLMRSTASKRGFDLYIVADHAFGMPPNGFEDYFNYFDAITNYDVYGSLGRFHVGPQKLQKFYKDQAQWKAQAAMQDCHFMPSVTPGFNDRGVRLEVNHQPLSRKLTNTSGFGSLFQASLEYAMELVDTDADNLIVITSFNEWHEDTQIEPAIGRLTNVPYNYTMGLEYEGYGTLYLDILREMTTGASFNSSLTSPISLTPTAKMPLSGSSTAISNPFAPHYTVPQPNPTSLQSRAPTCSDDRSALFATFKDGQKPCSWLLERRMDQWQYCHSNHEAYYICGETCGRCAELCQDTDDKFEYNGRQRPCLWLRLRPHIQDIVCFPGFAAYDTICPATCHGCETSRR